MRFVTVYTSFSPADAQLIRSRLEAAGFLAQVAHELSALSMDGYALAAGGIRVQVPEDVAEEARALIDAPDTDPT
jgi:hypothetical protein